MKQWKKQQRQQKLAKKLQKQRAERALQASIVIFIVIIATSLVAIGRWYNPVVIKKVYAEVKKVIAPPPPTFQELVKANLINPEIKTGGYPYWGSYDKKDKCFKGEYGTWIYKNGGNVPLYFTIDPSNKDLINKFQRNYGEDTLFTYETIKPTTGICGTNILTSITTYAEIDATVAKIIATK